MDFLIQHLKQKQEEHKEQLNLSSSLMTAWYAFDKYYKLTDQSPAYAAALLLHPSYRKEYVETHWGNIKKTTVRSTIELARRLWKKQYKPSTQDTRQQDADNSISEFMKWKAQIRQPKVKTDDEFERFITVCLPTSRLQL